MTYDRLGAEALDYSPCHYGGSALAFRGPTRRIDGGACLVLGGTETYGRFVERPYPALVERATGIRMVNLGCVNAGIDAFLNDPALLAEAAHGGRSVVQVTGAHNLTNRYYAVHPRRNDRFLRASAELAALYPQLDVAEVHFTRHLLAKLQERSAEHFARVAAELKSVWVRRMRQLLSQLPAPRLLLWIGEAPPPPAGDLRPGPDPLLVDAAMVAEATAAAEGYVEVVLSTAARIGPTAGMIFSPLEAAAAAEMPGPAAHAEIARALVPALRALTVVD